MHGFFCDRFRRQAAISCYICVFVSICCAFDAMCVFFLIGFVGRPPLVAICVCFWFSYVFDAMCMGLLIGFADRPLLVAMCVRAFSFSCLLCYVHG